MTNISLNDHSENISGLKAFHIFGMWNLGTTPFSFLDKDWQILRTLPPNTYVLNASLYAFYGLIYVLLGYYLNNVFI